MSLTQELLALPEKANVDVLVAMSPENFAYVAKTHIITVRMIAPRQAYAVLPQQGEPKLLVCSIEESLAQEESWIEDIHTYTEFKDYPIDALVKLLKDDMGFKRGRLGIDLSYLPQTSYARLKEQLPDVEIIDTTDAVAQARAIKTDEEVARMEHAVKVTHRAVLDAMAASRRGDSEKAMANRIAQGIIEGGADTILFMCFSSGKRTCQAHAHATDHVPQESEIIRFDVGGTFGPWSSDFARTYSTGNPTKLQTDTYRALRTVEEETINMIRPGVTAEDAFYACKESFKKHGIAFHMPHVGHSYGVELHENPMLRPGDKTVIQKGMVFNVEPFCFDENNIGYHLEDLFVVTDNEPRILTLGLPPKEIPVIGEKLEGY
jgi:Xaa-Pro dipeptidase